MEVLVYIEHGREIVGDLDVEGLCQFAMLKEQCPDDTEMSVSFVTNEEIAHLNSEYRNIDAPTDVLSFECDNLDDELSTDIPEGQPYQLGDIVIAPDVAVEHAREYGTTIQAELELLLVHGVLHLCGWDHLNDADAEVMEAREQLILEEWAHK